MIDHPSLTEALQAEIRAAKPGITIEIATAPHKGGWRATVAAGFTNAAFPMWQADAEGQSQAVEDALTLAAHYWAGQRVVPFDGA